MQSGNPVKIVERKARAWVQIVWSLHEAFDLQISRQTPKYSS